jgi:hypothetical protein
MNEDTTKLVEQLATKLGTTSEYLWNILLKQAPVDAAISLVQILLMVSAGYFLVVINNNRIAYNKENADSYSDDSLYCAALAVGGVIYVLMLFFCLGLIEDVINGFFNPEYWALNKILNTISK